MLDYPSEWDVGIGIVYHGIALVIWSVQYLGGKFYAPVGECAIPIVEKTVNGTGVYDFLC